MEKKITVGYIEYSNFKHGCKHFGIRTSHHQTPAEFVYKSIGIRCPFIQKNSDKTTKENNSDPLTTEHTIDILL
jgi:hypothetical protein